ncbi:unnamed protein product [Rotaria sp. Silwood2]|nr:unnamed protein product [Rotaria sp. Silwood2]
MPLTDLRSKYGSVDTLLLENQFDQALNVDILNDIKVLENVNYNVYGDVDLFVKKLEAKSETHKDDLNDELQKLEVHSAESVALKENVTLTFDIDKMYSRVGPKPSKRSKR